MKRWQIIKTVLYTLAGLYILIAHNSLFEPAKYIVGSVITLFGLDLVLDGIIEKTIIKEKGLLTQALTHILVGLVLFLIPDNIEMVCAIWAVWSIFREGKELSECLVRFTEKKMAFFNTVESIIVIVLSFIMVLHPTEHHVQVHIIILGIELILEVFFPILNSLIDNYLMKRRKEKNSDQESSQN